jgi:hypothetical protein
MPLSRISSAGSRPILQGAAGVKHGRACLPRVIEQFVVADDPRAGQDVADEIGRQRRGVKQPARTRRRRAGSLLSVNTIAGAGPPIFDQLA